MKNRDAQMVREEAKKTNDYDGDGPHGVRAGPGDRARGLRRSQRHDTWN